MEKASSSADATSDSSTRARAGRADGAFLGQEDADTADEKPRAFQLKFDDFPKWMRVGPWRPQAYATISAVVLALIYVAPGAISTFDPTDGWEAHETTRMQYALRAAAVVWMLGLLVYMLKFVGPYPLASFTMLSWCLCLVRYGSWLCGWSRLASALRFPSLVQNTITVVVWWCVLVPLIMVRLKDKTKQSAFLKFNRSFFLINVHLLNLPLAVLDALSLPRRLHPFDLWIGIAISFAYLLFYLLCLDKNGFHFYIILSPRTPFCGAVYLAFVATYYGLFRAWDAIAVSLLEHAATAAT